MLNVFTEESALIGIYTILIIWIFYFFLSAYAIYHDHDIAIMVGYFWKFIKICPINNYDIW